MIERIEIARCASYGIEVEKMDDLASINFVYGPNSAGKTTVSRLIEDASPYPACAVHWQRGTELETLVYNSDFIDTNFNQRVDLKGIFTLGQKDIETQNKIDQAKKDVDALIRRIEQLTFTLQGTDGAGGKCSELEAVESRFRDECWEVKTKHDDKLQGAMTGYRHDKQKFKDRLISECAKTPSQATSQIELETRAASVFAPTPSPEPSLPTLNDTAFLAWEADTVLKKRVIGKADVDIAAMIKKLGNSDWVKQGIAFFEINDGDCPFCQQRAPEQLAASLAEYFDEAFTRDTAAIAALRVGYKLDGERLQQAMQTAISSASRFLDVEKLKGEKSIFDSRFQLNQQHTENKVKEPSQLVTLEPLANVLTLAKQLISDANRKIQDHNTMVANLASEKRQLTNQVWAYFAKVEIDSAFTKYQADRANVEKAIGRFQSLTRSS